MLEQIIKYVTEHRLDLLLQLRDHLLISLLALLSAALIAIPLGYWMSERQGKGEKWVENFFQILRVIPSLALLVLFIPIMGVGIRPAVAALFVLAVPPILLNTATGFKEVPDFMLECADGIGLREKEKLWKVKVPLALPFILSGVRTSLVEVVASATLAAKIGAGGLGEVIFTGLGLNRPALLIIGGVGVAVLSLSLGFLYDRIVAYVLRYKD